MRGPQRRRRPGDLTTSVHPRRREALIVGLVFRPFAIRAVSGNFTVNNFMRLATDPRSFATIYAYFRLYEKMRLSDRTTVAPTQKPMQRATHDSSDLAVERDSTAISTAQRSCATMKTGVCCCHVAVMPQPENQDSLIHNDRVIGLRHRLTSPQRSNTRKKEIAMKRLVPHRLNGLQRLHTLATTSTAALCLALVSMTSTGYAADAPPPC